jgi:DNA-binding MarR family transcriptional regulator
MGNDELLKLDNQLCFVLYASSRALTQAYRPFLNELDLTYPQYLVLLVLWEQEGLTVNQLGEKLCLDNGTLTPLLKRMEKAGIIKRQRSNRDERKVFIFLTKKAKALKEKAYKVPEHMICNSGVTAEHYVALKENLEDLLKCLKAAQQKTCQIKQKEA